MVRACVCVCMVSIMCVSSTAIFESLKQTQLYCGICRRNSLLGILQYLYYMSFSSSCLTNVLLFCCTSTNYYVRVSKRFHWHIVYILMFNVFLMFMDFNWCVLVLNASYFQEGGRFVCFDKRTNLLLKNWLYTINHP